MGAATERPTRTVLGAGDTARLDAFVGGLELSDDMTGPPAYMSSVLRAYLDRALGAVTAPAATSIVIRVRVNGRDIEMLVPVRLTVAELLRDRLGLTGTKVSCEMQVCGVCTVLVDGNPVSSCATLACDLDGTDVLTIEGLARGRELHPVQEAFIVGQRPAVRVLHARFHHDGRRPCWTPIPTPAGTRCGSGWTATCAAAPATSPSRPQSWSPLAG